MNKFRVFLVEQGFSIAWVIATVATFGSLYFSEIMGYMPCNLCWYQRILMYPLVIVLGIATARKDLNQTIYVLPITIWACAFRRIIMQWRKRIGSSIQVIYVELFLVMPNILTGLDLLRSLSCTHCIHVNYDSIRVYPLAQKSK